MMFGKILHSRLKLEESQNLKTLSIIFALNFHSLSVELPVEIQ